MYRRGNKRSIPETESVIAFPTKFKPVIFVKSQELDKNSEIDDDHKSGSGDVVTVPHRTIELESSEKLLEKSVLGGETTFVEHLQKEDGEHREVIGVIDREEKKAAWQDEEDDTVASLGPCTVAEPALPVNTATVFSQKRKKQFEKVVGSTPSWAELKKHTVVAASDSESDDTDDDDDDDSNVFLRRTGDYITSSNSLPRGALNIHKVANANKEQYTQGCLSAMEFHPTSQVMLTAGLDTSLHIFQVDGKLNPKIQTVVVEQYPILNAHFSGDGTEVIMSSRSRWYYVYDMMAGKLQRISFLREVGDRQPVPRFSVSPDCKLIAFQGLYGFIHLITAKNKEFVTTLKMNGSVQSLAFSGDGTRLFSFGDDGDVYIWDMNTRDCIHKFEDDGCLKGSTISVSKGGKYVACGSHSGVVNIYNDRCLTETKPKPIKAIMNLTTQITSTRFNCTSEILAAASFHSKCSIKLIHLPDCNIFANFPTTSSNTGLTSLVDFSPNSGYFALGNNLGKALLYRLNHYKNY